MNNEANELDQNTLRHRMTCRLLAILICSVASVLITLITVLSYSSYRTRADMLKEGFVEQPFTWTDNHISGTRWVKLEKSGE